jgi:hypothetical protein
MNFREALQLQARMQSGAVGRAIGTRQLAGETLMAQRTAQVPDDGGEVVGDVFRPYLRCDTNAIGEEGDETAPLLAP